MVSSVGTSSVAISAYPGGKGYNTIKAGGVLVSGKRERLVRVRVPSSEVEARLVQWFN